MIVEILSEVPDNIFNGCLYELSKINWNMVNDGRKKGVFETSTSIHLRSHDVSGQEHLPNTIDEFSAIVNCADNPRVIARFTAHYKAALWIKNQVNGISLGRIMIVRLEPRGSIALHCDPGAYFEKHSRYHIPLITNPGVKFVDKENNKFHMPVKTLCRLNNLDFHGLENESDEVRIHLIADIAVAGGNSAF